MPIRECITTNYLEILDIIKTHKGGKALANDKIIDNFFTFDNLRNYY